MSRAVLVVDDDATQLYLTIAMIEECGFVATGVASGDRAQRMIRAHGDDIGIVITDLRMPGNLDGVALAKWIRESCAHIRVFVTSGFEPHPKVDLPDDVIFIPKVWLTVDVIKFVLSAQHGSVELMRKR